MDLRILERLLESREREESKESRFRLKQRCKELNLDVFRGGSSFFRKERPGSWEGAAEGFLVECLLWFLIAFLISFGRVSVSKLFTNRCMSEISAMICLVIRAYS